MKISHGMDESLAVGGQALIEGVMVRRGERVVICVRDPGGDIQVVRMQQYPLQWAKPLRGIPVLRGVILLLETLYFGVKALLISANIALDEEEEFTGFDYLVLAGMVLGITGFFVAVPVLLANLTNLEGLAYNIADSLLRLGLFTLYLFLVSRWGEVQRVFQYHGAEHKAINAYESQGSLDPSTASQQPRLHPRCGTSFLFISLATSVVLFSLLPQGTTLIRISYRLALVPLIAGVSYEALKASSKSEGVLKVLSYPGLLIQRLTTKEPTLDMLEVAVKAIQTLVDEEEG